MNALALLALLFVQAPAPSDVPPAVVGRPLSVLVVQAPGLESCVAAERTAAWLELGPRFRVVRDHGVQNASLEGLRLQAGADLAVRGQRSSGGGIALELAKSGTVSRQNAGPLEAADLEGTLNALWRSDLPTLPLGVGTAAANEAALEAACRGEAATAYALSGVMVGDALRGLVAPPPDARGLLARWARGRALLEHRAESSAEGPGRSGHRVESKKAPEVEAESLLKEVVAALSRGEAAPLWRAEPHPGASPSSALDLLEGSAVAFQDGSFVAWEARSGRERWRRDFGPATPHLVPQGDGSALALLPAQITALDLASGKVRFNAAAVAPSPELVSRGTLSILSDSESIFALDKGNGSVRWRVDPLTDLLAGPVAPSEGSPEQGWIAVPGESEVLFLEPTSGRILRRVEVGDEVSAPLTLGPHGLVWVLVGGDQVVRIDGTKGVVDLRVRDLPGIEWPAVPLEDQLTVSFRRGNRRFVADLGSGPKNGIRRLVPGPLPPLLAVPDAVVEYQDKPSGLVARNAAGKIVWRTALPKRPTLLVAAEDASKGRAEPAPLVAAPNPERVLIAAAVASKVLILDGRRGTVLLEIELGAPIRALALAREGAVASVEGGAVYGLPLPGDPRLAYWQRAARLDLARAAERAHPAVALAALKPLLGGDEARLEAAALAARLEMGGNPRSATERLLALLDQLPGRDPIALEAQAALGPLLGLEARLSFDPPLRALVPTGSVLVLANRARVFAITPPPACVPGEGGCAPPNLQPRWSQSSAPLAALGSDFVEVGGNVVRASDGQSLGKSLAPVRSETDPASLPDPRMRGVGNTLLRLEQIGDHDVLSLVCGAPPCGAAPAPQGAGSSVRTPGPSLLWRVDLEGEGYVLLAVTEAWAILRRNDEGVLLRHLTDGGSAGAIAVPKATSAVISGTAALFALEKQVALAPLQDGARPLLIARPAGLEVVLPIPGGWLLAGGSRVKTVQLSGRTAFDSALPAPLLSAATAGDTAFLALADGQLWALDLLHGAFRGKVRLGKATLAATPQRLFALREDGALFLFEADRALQSQRAPGRQRISP